MGASRAAADTEAEFRLFAIGQQRTLYRAALVLTADPGAAEDLVQTALMRTYAAWDRLRGEAPAAYARRVMTNANIDRWRRDRGREQLTDEVPEIESRDESADVASRDAVLRALVDLSPQERRVVMLRFLEDFSEAETARTLGIPAGTVKSVTHRAVAKLRASIHMSAGEVAT